MARLSRGILLASENDATLRRRRREEEEEEEDEKISGTPVIR